MISAIFAYVFHLFFEILAHWMAYISSELN